MGFGSGYGTGMGLRINDGESYMPLIEQWDKTAAMAPRGPSAPQESFDEVFARKRAMMGQNDLKNQYMAQHHGRMPSEFELKEQGQQSTQDIANRVQTEAETQGQFSRGMEERKQGEAEKGAEFERGMKTKAEGRAAESHANKMTAEDMAIDKEKRTLDHQEMMKGFLTGDPRAIESWFVKNAPRRKDGSQAIPQFDFDPNEGWFVMWPGATNAEPIDQNQLGTILNMLSPKWEAPKSEAEMAKTALDQSKASYGGMSAKDRAEMAMKWGKGYAEGGEDFEKGVARSGMMPAGMVSNQTTGKTVSIGAGAGKRPKLPAAEPGAPDDWRKYANLPAAGQAQGVLFPGESPLAADQAPPQAGPTLPQPQAAGMVPAEPVSAPATPPAGAMQSRMPPALAPDPQGPIDIEGFRQLGDQIAQYGPQAITAMMKGTPPAVAFNILSNALPKIWGYLSESQKAAYTEAMNRMQQNY